MKTFKFRLVISFCIVGIVPLVFAVLTFYSNSDEHLEIGMDEHVKLLHEHVIERMVMELDQLQYIAMNLNADPFVQAYLHPNEQVFVDDEQALKHHLDSIITRQKHNYPYIQSICFSFYDTGTSYCTNYWLFDDDVAPINSKNLTYHVFEHEDGLDIALYSPLYPLRSEIVRGYMVIVYDFSSLLKSINNKYAIDQHVLANQEGQIIFNSKANSNLDVAFDSEGHGKQAGHFVHEKKWEYYNLALSTAITIESKWMLSLRGSLRNTIFVYFLLFSIISAISFIILIKTYIKPIQNLRRLMKRAEQGDLKAYWASSNAVEMDQLGEGYNQMLNRLEELIKQVKWEEALKKDAEIEALRYQLNPHFIYNTLNTIKWVAKIHKTPQISEVVSALVRLLQASLGKSGDFITIKEEIALIDDYMAIQSFRYGDRVTIEYDIEDLSLICLIPRMLLQPLVENALIHGIEPNNPHGTIIIRIWLDRDLLFCEVEDNGKGMPAELLGEERPTSTKAKEKVSSIGLNHIREKIKLYYGPDYKMYIYNKKTKGTVIRLFLPIHRNEE